MTKEKYEVNIERERIGRNNLKEILKTSIIKQDRGNKSNI